MLFLLFVGDDDDNRELVIGLGVGIPVFIILVIVIAVAVYFCVRKQKRSGARGSTPSMDGWVLLI